MLYTERIDPPLPHRPPSPFTLTDTCIIYDAPDGQRYEYDLTPQMLKRVRQMEHALGCQRAT